MTLTFLIMYINYRKLKTALTNKKINNLKAFYQKAMKDDTLNSFSVVNLRFDKQVICTKK